MSCRLPQTPRTPSVGMAHYFDDVFYRHVQVGTPRSPTMPRIRRSSTSRSIGARSDFESVDTNGDYDDEDHDGIRTRRLSRAASVYSNDPDRLRAKDEADAHLHHYISEQLERVRNERGVDGLEQTDEIEAHASE